PCQTSLVYSGSSIRSSSVCPLLSNRHSSTLVAWAENSEKLTPIPSQVAPRGSGDPSLRRETLSAGGMMRPSRHPRWCWRAHRATGLPPGAPRNRVWMSGREPAEDVADAERDHRGGDGLGADDVAELAGHLVHLAGSLVVEPLGLRLAVAGHLARNFLHAAAHLTGGSFQFVTHVRTPAVLLA